MASVADSIIICLQVCLVLDSDGESVTLLAIFPPTHLPDMFHLVTHHTHRESESVPDCAGFVT